MAPSHLLDPGELADIAMLAEDLGFDSVFVTDQFQPWRGVGHAPAAVPWLAYVGARTTRIALGANALATSRRRTPSMVAQEFATLGCLLPGRVLLSLGTGHGHDDVAATGRRWPSAPSRQQRLQESLAIVRRLWEGERVTFGGRFFRTQDASVHDLPEIPVPLLVTALTPGEARLAGELADGMMTTSGTGVRQQADVLVPTARTAALGRASLDNILEVKVSYDENPRRAAKSAKPWMPTGLLDTDTGTPVLDESMRGAIEGDLATEWLVASSPDQIMPLLREYATLGFGHLVFSSPGNNQERFLRAVAADLMPILRREDPGIADADGTRAG
nr:LLM class flavin-dependent oxidoreductase [Propionicicella superfundia]